MLKAVTFDTVYTHTHTHWYLISEIKSVKNALLNIYNNFARDG